MIKRLLDDVRLTQYLSVKESFASLDVELELEYPFSDACEEWIGLLGEIPERDSATLSITISGEIESTSGDQESLLKVRDHVRDSTSDERARIKLAISKELKDDCLSVYSISAFSDFISSVSVKDFLVALEQRFKNEIWFEVFSETVDFGSETIHFTSATLKGRHHPAGNKEADTSRTEKLSLFRENCLVTGISSGRLLPSDLYLCTPEVNSKIFVKFNEACALLSLIFLASTSEIKATEEFSYRFHGYKAAVYENVKPSDIRESCEYLQKIVSWCYEGGSCADKLGLVRNIVSIHLDSSGNPRFDKQLHDAIQSNYQIYLRENVQSYLEVKNKIGELLVGFIEKTSAISDDLLDSLKNNVAIIMTFLLTVVVVNGLKDNGEDVIFSNVYLGVVFVVSVVSAIWLLLLKKNLLHRYSLISSSLADTIKNNYKGVLLPDEIDECVAPAIQKNKITLGDELDGYAKLWKILLLSFCFLYLIGNFLFVERSITKVVWSYYYSRSASENKMDDQRKQASPETLTPGQKTPAGPSAKEKNDGELKKTSLSS